MSSKVPMVDGDTRRALCSQPLAQELHGGSGKAQGAGGGGGFGLAGAALGISGSKKHCTNVLGFSCLSPFLTAAILSKSKGELWLHPYLWQSHLLSLTPPREAWHHSSLCSWKDSPGQTVLPMDATWVPLQCLSTGQRQQGWSMTAHSQVKVCADRTRGPLRKGTLASHCYKVLTVTSSGCETQAALGQVFPRASSSIVVGSRDGKSCAHSAAGHSQATTGNS